VLTKENNFCARIVSADLAKVKPKDLIGSYPERK